MVDKNGSIHFDIDDLPWSDYSAWYPEDMTKGVRGKRIIGPGGFVDTEKTLFGLLEMDPGAYYPLHRHQPAEVYFIISGRAECHFGDDVFFATQGTVIRTEPNAPHSFRNIGEEPFRAVAYWYSENEDSTKLSSDLELLE